jgi:lipopolysaccharide/colanic/teichoic acid biosynthesis glycosyltransferase
MPEWQRHAKRALDITVAGLGLLALLPLFVLVALAITLEDRGPVLFLQRRVGLRGRVFLFPKFRSMVINAHAMKAGIAGLTENKDGVTVRIKRDPRITRIGRFLRRSSIDELPQLWCVLVGDMSLVGPRPAVPIEVARYTREQRERLAVKPGLTCYWQVQGRSDVPFEKQVELDRRYIAEQSLWLDLRLLLATIPAVLSARGAY